MELILVRDLATDTETMGKLYVDGKFFGYTCEDTIRIVKAYGDTCIPFRRDYKVRTTYSPRFKRDLPLVWTNDTDLTVRNRNGDKWEGIRFHGGNHHMHTLGCILIAKNRYINKPTKFDYNGKTYTFNNWIQGSLVDDLIKLIGKNTVKFSIVHDSDFKDNRITIDRNLPVFKLYPVPLNGDNVCLIQNALNLAGFKLLYPVWDETFDKQVKAYQASKGLVNDGTVGEKTLKAMNLIWNGYELEQGFDYINNKTI